MTGLQVVNAHVLNIMNNNFLSVKVRPLLSTMALFTPSDISLPIMLIDIMTFNKNELIS